jgi:hypothetical protein
MMTKCSLPTKFLVWLPFAASTHRRLALSSSLSFVASSFPLGKGPVTGSMP